MYAKAMLLPNLVQEVTGPLTDTQLRTTPVPVSLDISALSTESTLSAIHALATSIGAAITSINQKTVEVDTSLLENILSQLSSLLLAVKYPANLDRSSLRDRVTALIESGTVTTVTTVTGVTNLDGYQAKLNVINGNYNAWANTVRRNIT